MNFKRLFLELVETLLSSFLVLGIIYATLALPERVSGSSMTPTLLDGDRILVERVTKHFKPLERGDIVVFHPPYNSNIDLVKRIVGIPGDIVKILNCKVYISRDGKRFVLDEDYLSPDVCTQAGPELKEGRSLKLKDGEYAVLGDNRGNSADSRFFGVIDESSILGKVVFRFYPIDRSGFF